MTQDLRLAILDGIDYTSNLLIWELFFRFLRCVHAMHWKSGTRPVETHPGEQPDSLRWRQHDRVLTNLKAALVFHQVRFKFMSEARV